MVTARAGFTLAEVVVAMTLLCVAGLGVAATGLVAIQTFTRAELQEQALRQGEIVLDSLLALPTNTAGARFLPQAQLTWNAADSATTLIVTILYGRETIELIGER